MARNRSIIKKIAKSRMYYLFALADEVFPEDRFLANRYVFLARKYAQRAKLRIPKKWKLRICHHCKAFLYPGINCRYRMQSRKGKGSHITLTCLECNNSTRYYIKTKNSD
ncbi:MAG: ribonuclease P [Promethearchaeota archaeon]|nr:MAG: ribonuclease P [Candidatus Lokiarchaeota archaeon]